MIRRLFAAYLQWLVDIDLEELDDRVRDGSASGTWVIALLQDINERRAFIEALRAPRARYYLERQ